MLAVCTYLAVVVAAPKQDAITRPHTSRNRYTDGFAHTSGFAQEVAAREPDCRTRAHCGNRLELWITGGTAGPPGPLDDHSLPCSSRTLRAKPSRPDVGWWFALQRPTAAYRLLVQARSCYQVAASTRQERICDECGVYRQAVHGVRVRAMHPPIMPWRMQHSLYWARHQDHRKGAAEGNQQDANFASACVLSTRLSWTRQPSKKQGSSAQSLVFFLSKPANRAEPC
ncbi:hypothetical protein J3F83DRAFT_659017 [Trichoderma novae-zelandiae]